MIQQLASLLSLLRQGSKHRMRKHPSHPPYNGAGTLEAKKLRKGLIIRIRKLRHRKFFLWSFEAGLFCERGSWRHRHQMGCREITDVSCKTWLPSRHWRSRRYQRLRMVLDFYWSPFRGRVAKDIAEKACRKILFEFTFRFRFRGSNFCRKVTFIATIWQARLWMKCLQIAAPRRQVSR